MTSERPAWADDLTNLLLGMSKGNPRPLLAGLAVFAGAEILADEFSAFIGSTAENDPALTQLRLALAAWDADESGALLDEGGLPTDPHTPARRDAVCRALSLDQATVAVLATRVPVFEKPVIVISKRFEPWYEAARKQRARVYWNDYEGYLRDTRKWPAESIAALDQTTTDVVERLSDPTRQTVKATKGLVVGYVQSGKTANFTGVAAKAIDAGYRLIIVLTGTIEILRAQTQRRMDMELMGVENILAGLDPKDLAVAKELDYQQDADYLAGRFIRHGEALEQPGVVHISRVTTHRSDYKRLPQGLTRLKFQRTDKQKPLNHEVNLFNLDAYMAVIKKNKAPLRKLIQDLTPLKSDLAQLPVLIIDDESDQASVDTTNPKARSSAEDRKTINKLIIELLRLCPRAQYVGYTATPFANVFVDPDDESDLFPADFVLSLTRPPGYMGVREFHDVGKRWDDEDRTIANSNELAHVRALQGDAEDSPSARRHELQQALDAWMLSGAIKKFRESVGSTPYRHHTMLIHESVKQAEHSAVADEVRALWKTSKFTSSEGLERLRRLYDSDFFPVMQARAGSQAIPGSFDALKPFVATAFQEMTLDGDPILVVNSDKAVQEQQKKLDFEADKVWRILVGGTQLSRGFTIEGLTVSYFRRKAGQSDTLMQAGRWFGFRLGYQDLVRLYIRRDQKADLYEAFEALLMDEEAFRQELLQYEGLDDEGIPLVEPRQIPPLVSQHLPWLRPTARNKMWNAVIDSKATARGFQDLYGLPARGEPRLIVNLRTVGLPLINVAVEPVHLALPTSGTVEAKVGSIGAADFLKLFNKMSWHGEFYEVIQPLRKFLESATLKGRITEWTVVWPQPIKNVVYANLTGAGSVPIIKRSRRFERNSFVGSDSKHRDAALPIIRGEDVNGVGGSPGRGALLIYLVDDRPDGSTAVLSEANVVPLISLAAPASATPHARDLIQWVVRVKEKEHDAAVDITS